MYQIFIGSILLSLIHAAIPNHWIPLISIGRAEKWNQKQTLWATIITGFAHTLSTVFVGIAVGLLGYKLAANYQIISSTIAPTILLIIGLVYLTLDIRGNPHHTHEHVTDVNLKNKTSKYGAILITLSISMFLTPCVEIEAYYFQAGTIGWTGIWTVSIVYTLTTVITMLLLVYLGLKGINRIKSHFLEHHEKGITGIVLIVLGILAFLIKY